MKKSLAVAICFIIFIFLAAGCQSKDLQAENEVDSNLTEIAPTQKLPSSENDVTLATEEDQYSTSVDKIIVEIVNDSDSEFNTGAHVFLEKKIENVWCRVPMKAEFFTEEGISHFPGQASALGFIVNKLKYALTPGQYRATISGLAAPFEVVK